MIECIQGFKSSWSLTYVTDWLNHKCEESGNIRADNFFDHLRKFIWSKIIFSIENYSIHESKSSKFIKFAKVNACQIHEKGEWCRSEGRNFRILGAQKPYFGRGAPVRARWTGGPARAWATIELLESQTVFSSLPIGLGFLMIFILPAKFLW